MFRRDHRVKNITKSDFPGYVKVLNQFWLKKGQSLSQFSPIATNSESSKKKTDNIILKITRMRKKLT